MHFRNDRRRRRRPRYLPSSEDPPPIYFRFSHLRFIIISAHSTAREVER